MSVRVLITGAAGQIGYQLASMVARGDMLGPNQGEWVIMSVPSDGSYNVPKDIIFGFPVEIANKEWKIVQNLKFDDWAQGKFDLTLNELKEEFATALEMCK